MEQVGSSDTKRGNQMRDWVPDSTAEDSTAEDSTAEDFDIRCIPLYLPTTLLRSISQNADSTVELEKMRTLRRSFSKTHILLPDTTSTCGP